MAIEIERKFLVNHKKWELVDKPAGDYYRQGYILNNDNRTVRIRVANQSGYITIKGSTIGIARKEFEYEIPVKDAVELLNDFTSSQIEKTRYKLYFEGKLWEVDVFAGDNSGLITAEIELRSEDEKFAMPDWISAEVSDDKRYFNSNLSVNPYKNWGADQ